MYNDSYEEYIRSILGYPNYTSDNFEDNNNYMPSISRSDIQNTQLEDCYPEIYKLIYPMIRKACLSNTRPVTPELVSELTNEIYLSIETDNEINLTINLNNEMQNTSNRNISTNIKKEQTKENRAEDRQYRNRTLQDLIRILLIRELLRKQGELLENRPPFPPPQRPPMRPPFPRYY